MLTDEQQDKLRELRAAATAADDAKFAAWEALRVREREIAATFADPFGRDNWKYTQAKLADAETARLRAAFNAARDAWHAAAKARREACAP